MAGRVKDVLEAMGRPTVLVDSSDTSQHVSYASGWNSASDHPATQRGSRSTALLRKVASETKTGPESLVLTDTAPLLISAETEYLARFVDCAIVVVESGTTTRGQLLAALNTLQRLDVAAVGFVLNRVKLAQADAAFRRSVFDIDQHHQAQSMYPSRRMERTSQVADGHLPDPKELPSESSVTETSQRSVSESAQSNSVTGRSTPAAPKLAAPKWVMAAPVKPWLPQPATPPDDDMPWWLSDVHPSDSSAATETEWPRSPSSGAQPRVELQRPAKSPSSWEDASGWSDDFTPLSFENVEPVADAAATPNFVEEAAPIEAARVVPTQFAAMPPDISERATSVTASGFEPTPGTEAAPMFAEEAAPIAVAQADPVEGLYRHREEVPFEPSSRLNPLRGLLFSLGLKNLGKTREAARLDEESPAALKSEPEPAMIERTFSQFAAPVAIAAAEDVPVVAPAPVQAVAPAPLPIAAAEAVPVATPVVEARVASAPQREVKTTPEFLPPREFVPVRGAAADAREDFDELLTLPSRRGQYKRRG